MNYKYSQQVPSGKITNSDYIDGQTIRMLDESEIGEIDAMAITESGKYFVSGV